MAVLEASGLTKSFSGGVKALDDVSFRVDEGRVYGFLGPNGAGKTTAFRIALGLAEATSGSATIFGHPYRELADPITKVGALLEASGFHPGRRGRDHLRYLATVSGISKGRVDEVLEMVGLAHAARRRVRTYSLGMRQRLSIAAALLGDPQLLILDEPANGLDPDGMRWLRTFLREQAAGGRTVVISSHVLAEVAQTVDEVVILNHGRLVAQMPIHGQPETGRVSVRCSDPAALAEHLSDQGLACVAGTSGELLVSGTTPEMVGTVAAELGVVIYRLDVTGSGLEEIYLTLTSGASQ